MAVSATDLPASVPTAAPADGGMSGRMLDFLAYLEFERGLSRNTLEAYRSDLLQLGAFLGRRRVDAVDVQHADLSAFLAELATGGEGRPPVAAATLQRKAACLRSFYRHLRREGVLDRDPTAELRARGKGSKERIVPIGREAVAAARAYLERGRPAFVGLGDEAHLFVNRRG